MWFEVRLLGFWLGHFFMIRLRNYLIVPLFFDPGDFINDHDHPLLDLGELLSRSRAPISRSHFFDQDKFPFFQSCFYQPLTFYQKIKIAGVFTFLIDLFYFCLTFHRSGNPPLYQRSRKALNQ